MDYETIRWKSEPPKVSITLDRPDVLNAINGRVLEELQNAVNRIEKKNDIRAVILDSSGDKAFSSGIDVEYGGDISGLEVQQVARKLHETFACFRFLEKPVVVAIDGFCLGAGLELAMSCDFLIATNRSKFGLPNVNRGIPAIVEAAILTHALSIFHVKEMAFTGEFWDVDKAERRGLLNACVEPEELDSEVEKWVEKLVEKSPLALATQKDIINKWMVTDLETAIDYSIQTVVLNYTTRDQEEGMNAFLEKRKPDFKGE